LPLSSLFVYGQEIHDFRTIDKDAIFTLSVSALQNIDAELQETKQTVNLLKEQWKNQQQQINNIIQSQNYRENTLMKHKKNR